MIWGALPIAFAHRISRSHIKSAATCPGWDQTAAHRAATQRKQTTHNMANSNFTKACERNRWLFVFSTGNAGSTTLLQVLNAVPDIELSGENDNLLDLLAHAAERTLYARDMGRLPGDKGVTWRNQPTEAVVRERVCQWLQDLLPHSKARIRGFKEIRFPPVVRLMRLFPKAQIILNYRADRSRAGALRRTSAAMAGRRYSAQPAFESSICRRECSRGLRGSTCGDVAARLPCWQSQMAGGCNCSGCCYSWRIDSASPREGTVFSQPDALKWAQQLPPQQVYRMPLEAFDAKDFTRLLRWLGITGCVVANVPMLNVRGRAKNVVHGMPVIKRACKFEDNVVPATPYQ